MEAFDKYVEQYDMNNYDVTYKYYHSYRVQKLCDELANRLELDEENCFLAHIIGLLHDIGRFEQLEKYNTYNDSSKMDHADYGVKVLFDDNVIEQFDIEKKYYRIIKIAVKNHNKFSIEQNINAQELLQAKIIRDADKIDIFNAFTDLNAYNITDCDDNVSPKIEDDFLNHKSILIADKRTKADKIIQTLAFLYDINYKESIEILKENRYIEKLYEQLSTIAKQKYKKYFVHILNYMDERMK